MQVPEGFNVTLFAGEPAITQPIGFCIDDRGRLWVAEAKNYPDKKAGKNDRIIILEDTDGDGRHDERIVFYDKLEYVSGIEVGFGGVWVMSIPNFYFIPDEDYDGVPDGEPKVLLDGFGTHANAHTNINGILQRRKRLPRRQPARGHPLGRGGRMRGGREAAAARGPGAPEMPEHSDPCRTPAPGPRERLKT